MHGHLIRISGFAADDHSVDRVEYKVRGSHFRPASGTGRWTANLRLAPGRNLVVVRAVDNAGQPSERQRVVLRRNAAGLD